MSYTPTTWVEGVTKLGPTNLNKLEQGVVDAFDAARHSVIWLQDYGADETGATYSDDAFAAAMADAQALSVTSGQVQVISGLSGTYKLGGYSALSGGTYHGPNLCPPNGVFFGKFATGEGQFVPGATFSFPNESGLPGAHACLDGVPTEGATTLNLMKVKGTIAPASVTYPGSVCIRGRVTVTYTGVTTETISTTATGVNAEDSATVNVASAAAFSRLGGNGGTFKLGGVLVTYTGKTATSFTGCGAHPATTGGETITDPYSAQLTGVGPGLDAFDDGTNCTFNICVMQTGGQHFDHTIKFQGPGGGSRALWCPYSKTNGSITFPQSTITIQDPTGFTGSGAFPTSGKIVIWGQDHGWCVHYTGKSGNDLTGCTCADPNSAGVQIDSGSSVQYVQPPQAMDGFYMGAAGKIDSEVSGFRFATVACGDHEQWGPGFLAINTNYAAVAFESPQDFNQVTVDSGNQFFWPEIRCDGNYWSAIWISAGNCLLAGTFYGGNNQWASCPWWVWKDEINGVPNADGRILDGVYVHGISLEAQGSGIVGSASYGTLLSASELNMGVTITGTSQSDIPVIAAFACNVQGLIWHGAPPSTSIPFVIGNIAIGDFVDETYLMHTYIDYMTAPFMQIGDAGSDVICFFPFKGGFFAGAYNTTITRGTLLSMAGRMNANYTPQNIAPDDNTLALVGIAATDWTAYGTRLNGPLITNALWGQVAAKVNADGDVTANSLVRANGGTHTGTIANASGIGDTNGMIVGRALTGGGTPSAGLAWIIISPALA